MALKITNKKTGKSLIIRKKKPEEQKKKRIRPMGGKIYG